MIDFSFASRRRAMPAWVATTLPALCLLFALQWSAFAHGVTTGDKGYIQETTGV